MRMGAIQHVVSKHDLLYSSYCLLRMVVITLSSIVNTGVQVYDYGIVSVKVYSTQHLLYTTRTGCVSTCNTGCRGLLCCGHSC